MAGLGLAGLGLAYAQPSQANAGAIFRIRLDNDEIYKLKIEVGIVNINGSNCLYSITNKCDIQNVLLPLLDKYILFTVKWLDFL